MSPLQTSSIFVSALLLAACGEDHTTPTDTASTDTLDSTDTSEVEVDVVPSVGRVIINEVECRGDEWVEIKNVGDASIDLGGMRINDGSGDGVRLPAVLLAPGEHKVIRGDFGLSCERDPAVLWQLSRELDRAPARGLSALSTWGRVPDGLGDFTATVPTPLKTNLRHVDQRPDLFVEAGPMPVVDLYVDAAAEDLLSREQKVWAPALFTWSDAHGATPPIGLELRIKGSITLRPWNQKPSLKLHFGRQVGPGPKQFSGVRKLSLHNLAYDPSVAREWLAYELMRDAGLAVPRVGWAKVRVNGVDKGLYAVVETYDEVFLADYYEGTIALYEADGDFGDNGELWGFFLDEGDTMDHAYALSTKIWAAQNSPGDPSRLIPEVDWEQLATLFALEDLLQHSDGMKAGCHNWFLHADKEGRWTFFPWSVDLTLVPTFGTTGPLNSCSKLAQLCDRDEGCTARFRRARDEAARMVLAGNYRERIVAIAERVEPFVKPTDEPWSTGEFWPDLTFDLVAAAHQAIDLLEARARAIRCATAAERGEVDEDNPTCDGFAGPLPEKP